MLVFLNPVQQHSGIETTWAKKNDHSDLRCAILLFPFVPVLVLNKCVLVVSYKSGNVGVHLLFVSDKKKPCH